MIEESVWQRFDELKRLQLREALALIGVSEILKFQAETEVSRLGQGDPTAPEEDVVKEVLRVRADTRGLLSIHHYGLQLAQEQENQHEDE